MTEQKPLTPKQEAFAQEYVKTGNASEAYRRAYNAENMSPQSVWNEASLLLSNPYVSVRIMTLQEELRERTLVTAESITRELEEVRLSALSQKDHSPAVSAIMGKAKVNGLLIEKNEHTGKDGGAIKIETINTASESIKSKLASLTAATCEGNISSEPKP